MVPGYGAAKAGTINLTANLARQWVNQGIRVNAIAPGLIDTPMTAPMQAFPELLAVAFHPSHQRLQLLHHQGQCLRLLLQGLEGFQALVRE
jgi:NAD(P)-dependent dehydrogenase (short-subunit alcohol dehydrogenase family)